jgi:2-hydroxychromene-2-carboxylate isomerase
MKNTIEFFFDFSSPYGYLAAHRIESIAKKYVRTVEWKPFLLGAVFKINEQTPLKDQALKWDYSNHDIEMTARRYNIEWRLPEVFPILTHAAGRTFY